MKNLRTLATWRLIIWSVLFVGTIFFFGCGSDHEDALEQPLEEQSPPSGNQSPAEVTPQLDVVKFTG